MVRRGVPYDAHHLFQFVQEVEAEEVEGGFGDAAFEDVGVAAEMEWAGDVIVARKEGDFGGGNLGGGGIVGREFADDEDEIGFQAAAEFAGQVFEILDVGVFRRSGLEEKRSDWCRGEDETSAIDIRSMQR